MTYLQSLPHPINPNCEAGHYYLLNNYNPGYFGNGNNAYTDTNANNTVFTIPPSSVPSIGDTLIAANVSWKYYGDQWNNYVPDPYQLNYGAMGATTRRVLQHLQPIPIRHFHHGQCRLSARRTFRTRPISITISSSERCRRFPSSSPADWWTAIPHPRNWTSSKASRRRSWTRFRPTRFFGAKRRS